MDVLNAAALAPASLHKAAAAPAADRRPEPKRLFPFRLPRLAALSSFLSVAGGGLSKALTYEEALSQSVGSGGGGGGGGSALDVDLGGALDGIVSFVSENPLVIGGGALAIAVPLFLSQLLQTPKNWGVATAKSAYAKLSQEPEAQLLDIREAKDVKAVGSPDVRSLKKKAVAVTFKRDDKLGFLQKLQLRFKDPANTTLLVLDKFDGNSELVAELVTANGFKAAYAIKDGAEGPRGWKNSSLPWLEPKKGLNIDFGDLISNTLGEGSNGLPVTLGLAAATGLGIFAFTEMETVLQLLGSAAIVQFVTKKFLFAEDRKVTLGQLDEFLNTKVAPKELADEIKAIGKAFLPSSTTEKASLPAPAEVNPETPASSSPDQEVKEAAPTETPAEVNLASEAEAKEEPVPARPRPLSPYPYYPDLKPPSSPSPSAP